jgi:AAA+ superfamily predicted ATPase
MGKGHPGAHAPEALVVSYRQCLQSPAPRAALQRRGICLVGHTNSNFPADFGAQLAHRPDPVPAILSHHRTGRIQLALFLLAAIGGTIYALDYVPLPGGWCPLILAWMVVLILLGTVYVKALRRQPHVDSLLDLSLDRLWFTAKLLLLANALWSVLDLLHGGGPLAALGTGWQRMADFQGTILSAKPNLLQAACLYPWLSPLLETFRVAARAREFEVQLAPGIERRIERNVRSARRAGAQGRVDQARALLTEAGEKLAGLAGYATDLGLLYHRQLLRYKIDVLLGNPLPAEGPDFSMLTSAPAPPRHTAGDHDQFEKLFAPIPAAGNGHHSANGNGNGRTAPPEQAAAGYGQYREFVDSLRERANVTWNDVAGLDDVVNELKTVLAMGMAQTPHGVRLDPPRRILLYGPPGTGKTLLTAALSHGFDAPFYNVKVSDVLSKFFGESTRLLSALFELAAEQGPAVLFFDEIDSISGNREAGGMDGEERRMISALLAQLDGLKQKGTSVPLFTIAATNLPWQLDSAILSRFEKQFYIPLPEAAARRAIFEHHLTARGFQLEAPWEKLIEATRGYSGRELSRLCQEAIRLMLAEANPRMEQLADFGQQAMRRYELKLIPVGVTHFREAFKKNRPQTQPQLLERYRTWQQSAAV